VRLVRLTATGFRNLERMSLAIPGDGMALLGPNGHGKTNVLEAAYYPVLFRSFRGAADADLTEFGGAGFKVECAYRVNGTDHEVGIRYTPNPKRKVIVSDGTPVERLSAAVGRWLAVAFIPDDVTLTSGPAVGRRQFLDRLLSLADREYLQALGRYRGALAQRNAALKRGAGRVADAYDGALAAAGSAVVRRRLAWVDAWRSVFTEEFAGLGETGTAALCYRGDAALAEPGGWPAALAASRSADEARRTTTVGPHRDDLTITLAGRPIRTFGSTGQHRSGAIALKLLELGTLTAVATEPPALILDDVFAELDAGRQRRLADRLLADGPGQVLISAPREDELPPGLTLPVWRVERGAVRPAEGA